MTNDGVSWKAKVMRPEAEWEQVGSVHVTGGRALVAGRLVANSGVWLGSDREGRAADVVVDADEIVLPGLVDLHCHLRAGGLNPKGVDLEQLARSGVLGAADAGSFGPETMDASVALLAREQIQTGVNFRTWSYLYGTGLHDVRPPGNDGAVLRAWERMHMTVGEEVLAGLKVRLGQSPACGDDRLLEMGRAIADRRGVRLMVHLTGSGVPLAGVLGRLRPGDVLSHAFHGRATGIIREDGQVSEAAVEAHARGVVFDVAHGRNHFSWRVFESALAKGVCPGSISTDVTQMSLGVEPVRNLLSVMSKLVGGGLHLEKALLAVSDTPSRLLGLVEPMKRCSVVICPVECEKDMADAEGALRRVKVHYVPRVVAASLGESMRLLVRQRSDIQSTVG